MLKLKKVAVTGGLSCGKSSVCRILKELGAYTVSADEIVHHLMSSDLKLGQAIIKLLGPEILVNQRIDRSRIAKRVFRVPTLLKSLEQLLHPAVYEEIEKEYQKQQAKPTPPPLFVAEIPLLFESSGENKFDWTVAVVSDPQQCLKRFIQLTRLNEEEFELRTSQQLTQIEKADRADYVLTNSSSLVKLQEVTRELYLELTEGF